MPSLRTLKINISEFPKKRALLQEITKLRALSLSRCGAVDHFEFLQYLPNLERLVLSGSETMKSLDFLHVLPKLKELVLYYNACLKNVEALKDHKNIQYLMFFENEGELDVHPDGFDNLSQPIELCGREMIEKYQDKLRQNYK